MALGEFAVDLDELCGADDEAPLLEPAQDLPGKPPLDRVWLDEDERLLRHARSLEILDRAR